MPDITTAASQQLPSTTFIAEIEARLGRRSTRWTRPDTGLSAAVRFLVTFDDGSRLFVKAASDATTEAWLQNEHLALQHAPTELAPKVVGLFLSESGFSVLMTEVLDGHWPSSHQGVDWRGGLEATIAAIERLSRTPGPSALPETPRQNGRPGWTGDRLTSAAIAAGVASPGWFAEHLEALQAAEAALDRSGTTYVHGDMRSDNVCLMPNGPKFVDWSSAARGAPETDLAAFLPAARLEGGPPPQAIMPNGGPWAASQAARMAAMASSPDRVPDWLRGVCWRLTAINLDWAVVSLGLDPRDPAG